jgi:hypothetical protein
VEKIPAALGFVKPGRSGNAFAVRRQADNNAALALKYEHRLAQRPGESNRLKGADKTCLLWSAGSLAEERS